VGKLVWQASRGFTILLNIALMLLTLGFDFGFSTGYAVSDILEFGIKVFYRGFLTTNYDDLYSFISGPIFVPTIKYKNAMLMLGYGKGKVGSKVFDKKLGHAILIEPKMYNEDSDKCLFIRFERNWNSQTTGSSPSLIIRNKRNTIVSLGVGFSSKDNTTRFPAFYW
jgi:hypothetical protein